MRRFLAVSRRFEVEKKPDFTALRVVTREALQDVLFATEPRSRLASRARGAIRSIQDFPKPGILFRDISTLLLDGRLFADVCRFFTFLVERRGCNKVAGIESRGFVFAAPVAARLSLPLVMIRKPGKLPYKTHSASYALEYGEDSIEVHEDAFGSGDRVALMDDLLATGGTMEAAVRLVREGSAEVGVVAFVVELADLGGRKKLEGLDVESLVVY